MHPLHLNMWLFKSLHIGKSSISSTSSKKQNIIQIKEHRPVARAANQPRSIVGSCISQNLLTQVHKLNLHKMPHADWKPNKTIWGHSEITWNHWKRSEDCGMMFLRVNTWLNHQTKQYIGCIKYSIKRHSNIYIIMYLIMDLSVVIN